jgi:hypothetical protein
VAGTIIPTVTRVAQPDRPIRSITVPFLILNSLSSASETSGIELQAKARKIVGQSGAA